MDSVTNVGLGARSKEDIALDLFRFVAATTGAGKHNAPSTGFSGSSAPKTEEQVSELLALYARCLKTVEGKEADQ